MLKLIYRLLYPNLPKRNTLKLRKTFLSCYIFISTSFILYFTGHTRQGLKCRICKMNVHVDCQEKAPKCQTKARLLRRQKSTSEIETRVPESTAEEESEYFMLHVYVYCYVLAIDMEKNMKKSIKKS